MAMASSLRRRVPHVLLRVLGEGDVGVLIVEGAVLGQDVLLVVPLQALPQLHVGHRVTALRVRDHLSASKKEGKGNFHLGLRRHRSKDGAPKHLVQTQKILLV